MKDVSHETLVFQKKYAGTRVLLSVISRIRQNEEMRDVSHQTLVFMLEILPEPEFCFHHLCPPKKKGFHLRHPQHYDLGKQNSSYSIVLGKKKRNVQDVSHETLVFQTKSMLGLEFLLTDNHQQL